LVGRFITHRDRLFSFIDARKLNSLEDKARPVDMGLFHADMEDFLDKSTAQSETAQTV
jgi:hypothetical protein